MTKDWLKNLEKHLPQRVGRAIEDADHVIDDFSLHAHWSHWHPVSTAPCNRELELRISDEGKISTLEFPCLLTNSGSWIDVDLGTRIVIQPLEWRIRQHNRSPQPHHSQIKPADRPELRSHPNLNTERDTSMEISDPLIKRVDSNT
jgi:hypothetical protein